MIAKAIDGRANYSAAATLGRLARTALFFTGCSGYPECKTLQQMDRKTGQPLPPKPPPKPTGLKCPKCNKKELLVRSGKRGDFISCSGYPKCRMTLPADRLDEFLKLNSEGQWPPADILAKAGGKASAAQKSANADESAEGATAESKPVKKKVVRAKRPKVAAAE